MRPLTIYVPSPFQGVLGYYIYTSPVAWPWYHSQTFTIPEIVIQRMPRIPGTNLVEYSFYQSEEYCRIQQMELIS